MNKAESYGEIKDGKLHIIKRDAFLEAIKVLIKGRYRIVIEKIYNKRSHPQNAYLWGVVYPIALKGFQDVGYREMKTIDQIHNFGKLHFLKKDIYNEETGDKWQTISSTTELTTIAFNEYIEDWRIFAIEYLNTTIPEPNEETQELKL